MEIRRWGGALAISLVLHAILLFLLLKNNSRTKVVELKEQALKTYIVSYVEQKRLLKKDEKLEVKTQAKNIKKITKSNELKLEKVIKQKTNKLVIDKNINAEVQEDLTLKNQNKTKTFKKLNPYSGVSSIINQEYNRSRQDHYKLNL